MNSGSRNLLSAEENAASASIEELAREPLKKDLTRLRCRMILPRRYRYA